MGQVVSAVSDLNPLSLAKSVVHDISVYVLNSCKSSCDCCGCWKFGFESHETHGDDDEGGHGITWH